MPAAKQTQYNFKHLLRLQLQGSRGSSSPSAFAAGSRAAMASCARCLAAALILELFPVVERGVGERNVSGPLPVTPDRFRFALALAFLMFAVLPFPAEAERRDAEALLGTRGRCLEDALLEIGFEDVPWPPANCFSDTLV